MITTLRTAAASAVATRFLARPESHTLGLIGCGAQASGHLEAICLVREIDEILIWGRSLEKAKAFADRHTRSGTRLKLARSAEEVRRAM